MSDDVCLDISNGAIWTITLNRPQTMNAITMSMAARLQEIFADAAANEHARCLIITGTGEEAFSAGFDIKGMADFDNEAMRDAFVQRDPLFKAIALHPLPVIAAVNGKAFGAGALMAAAADFRIAGPNAEFKVTAVNYGSANATWSLPRLVGLSRAKHILMTGRIVKASEGLMMGLFDEIANASALDTALELAAQIASKPVSAIHAIKALTNRSMNLDIDSAWQAEFDHVLEQLNTNDGGGEEIFGTFLSKRK